MITVTQDEFFARLKADKRDIHPTPEKQASLWKDRNGRVLGRSTPGYLCQGQETWALDASVGAP